MEKLATLFSILSTGQIRGKIATDGKIVLQPASRMHHVAATNYSAEFDAEEPGWEVTDGDTTTFISAECGYWWNNIKQFLGSKAQGRRWIVQALPDNVKAELLAKLVVDWGAEFRECWNAADEESRSNPTRYYYDMLDILHENVRDKYPDLTKEDWLEVSTRVGDEIPGAFWDGKSY